MKWLAYLFFNVTLILIFGNVSTYGKKTPNEVPEDLLNAKHKMRIVPGEYCRRNRVCNTDTEPLICYFKFKSEDYSTLGGACDFEDPPKHYRDAVVNTTCVVIDGYERTLLTINRMFPGPPMQGCVGDMIVMDYENHYQGSISTIHFHGFSQKYTPWSDGVPYVSQCPIMYSSTYRYWTYLDEAGTYFYHGHTGLTKFNGESGAIVVREPKENYVNGHLYDDDDHIIMVHDWLHTSPKERFVGRRFTDVDMEPINLLLNGKGIFIYENGTETNASLAHFYIRPGYRTRFRMVDSMATGCTSLLTIEGHRMLLIEKDGRPTKPHVCDSIASMSGERYDFVIEANKTAGNYWMQVRGIDECLENNLTQWGVLHYKEGSLEMPTTPRPSNEKPLPQGVMVNAYDGCNDTHVCLSQLIGNYEDNYPQLYEKEAIKLLLPFQLDSSPDKVFFKNYTYDRFFVGKNLLPTSASIANISFYQPSSPMMHQYKDIDPKEICDSCNRTDGIACQCSHVRKVPMNKTIEIIFVDNRDIPILLHHPMHFHGYFCNLVGYGLLSDLNITNYTNAAFIAADEKGLVKRNLDPNKKPIRIDTVVVPQRGYVIYRFWPDNPGFWFAHCHILTHLTIGMEMVIQVGELEDMVPIPDDLPRCANYKPSNLMLSRFPEDENDDNEDSEDNSFPSSQKSEGDGFQDSEGDDSQDSEGDDSQDSEDYASQDSEDDAFQGSEGDVSQDSKDYTSQDSQTLTSQESQTFTSKDSQTFTSKESQDSQTFTSKESQDSQTFTSKESQDSQTFTSKESQDSQTLNSEDDVSQDSEGDDSQDSEGDDSQDSEGDDSQDSEGDDSQDFEGDDSQDSEGDDSQDSEGDDSQDSEGDDSQDSEDYASQDSEDDAFQGSEGDFSQDSKDYTSQDSQTFTSQESQTFTSKESQTFTSKKSQDSQTFNSEDDVSQDNGNEENDDSSC